MRLQPPSTSDIQIRLVPLLLIARVVQNRAVSPVDIRLVDQLLVFVLPACSDKVASQFDSMFEGLGESQAVDEGDATSAQGSGGVASVKAMGDFDSGYDARAQAAARQAM